MIKLKRARPGFYSIEKKLHLEGFVRVAGIDEAGRGPLAGPVCAAVAIFKPGTRIRGVNDSKQLTPHLRDVYYDEIMSKALAVGVGLTTAHEIDRINALRLQDVDLPQEALIKGDARCFCIAAASIVAKVTRDRLMQRYHEEYPQYGHASHKGYGTVFHRRALALHGLSTLHRRTFCEFGFFGPLPFDDECVARGWTDEVRVKSASCVAFESQIARITDDEARRAVENSLSEQTDFLPFCEVEHLQKLLKSHLRNLRLAK
jgi:ribonuclease HII